MERRNLKNLEIAMVLLDFSRSETLAPMAWAFLKFGAAASCILMVDASVQTEGTGLGTNGSTGLLLGLALFEPAIDEHVLGHLIIFQELRLASLLGTNLTVIRECTLAFALRQYSLFCEGDGTPPEPLSYLWVCASSFFWFLCSNAFISVVSMHSKHGHTTSQSWINVLRYYVVYSHRIDKGDAVVVLPMHAGTGCRGKLQSPRYHPKRMRIANVMCDCCIHV